MLIAANPLRSQTLSCSDSVTVLARAFNNVRANYVSLEAAHVDSVATLIRIRQDTPKQVQKAERKAGRRGRWQGFKVGAVVGAVATLLLGLAL